MGAGASGLGVPASALAAEVTKPLDATDLDNEFEMREEVRSYPDAMP